MFKKCLLGALTLVTSVALASGQSNARLDELLVQPQAHLDLSAYLVLASAGVVSETTEPAQAFEKAVALGWLPAKRAPEDELTLEELSFLTMKALGLKGGLQWSLLPNPRAAYRELAAAGLINTSGGGARVVAGDEVVRTLGAAVAWKGEQK